MKKTARILVPLMLILVMVLPRTMTDAFAASANVTLTVNYRQSEARKMHSQINGFRSGTETWYWNQDNQTKTWKTGLGQLTYDYNLEQVAMQRCAELVQSYGHTRPDGTNYNTVYQEMGYTASCVGENIACGKSFATAQQMMTAFMEADKDYSGQTHRRNLLDSDYNAVGCACIFYNNTYYWVQEFAKTGTTGSATTANNSTTNVTVRTNLATGTATSDNSCRVSGDNSIATSINVANVLKSKLGVNTFDTIIVASANGYADALSGSYLAGKTGAPILMVDTTDMGSTGTASIIKYIAQNLTSGGTVYILGGDAAVSTQLDNAMPKGANVKRLAGPTRYETNLAILQEAGVTNETLLICSGKNYPDALSASATGKPVLLVGDSLTAEQKTFLSSHNSNRYYVIGGTAAVGTGVEQELKAFGKTMNRLAGETRHETSVLVAETFWCGCSVNTAVLATSLDYADGLLAAPLAQALHAPLILSCDSYSTAAVAYCQRHDVSHILTVGTTTRISNTLVASCLG